MDQKVPLETKTMSAIQQPMLPLRASLRRERIKAESQPQLVRLLAELLVQQFKRDRANKKGK